MFNHVQIKVADLVASRPFYAAVLGSLGYGVVLDASDAVGFGLSTNNMLEVSQATDISPVSHAVHLAFVADSQAAVARFHETALAQGATDNGPPGLRPAYEPGYFAAFVIDPNGHNLEAVFNQP